MDACLQGRVRAWGTLCSPLQPSSCPHDLIYGYRSHILVSSLGQPSELGQCLQVAPANKLLLGAGEQ